MDSVEKVQVILGNLTKPLYKDDPFSAGGRSADIRWDIVDTRGLSFQAFVNRILTFGVQNWGSDPNAAVYLAKYGFKNVSDCKVQCCSCKIKVDLNVFRGKLDILRAIAARSHKPNCRWLHISTPAEYFKIPRNPRKLAEDFLFTVKDLMTFSDKLPTIPEHGIAGKFTKLVMEALNLTEESQILLSSIYISLCGWVKTSDTSIQCNFCRRVFGLWHFINIQDALHGRPSSTKAEGRVVSLLFNQIRGETIINDQKEKNGISSTNDFPNPSHDSYPCKEMEPPNKDTSYESKSTEKMSVSNCSNDLHEETNDAQTKIAQEANEETKVVTHSSHSFFCAQAKKRNAIKILRRKVRRLQWRSQNISHASDIDQSGVQGSKCDIKSCGERKTERCSVSDKQSNTIVHGNVTNGSNDEVETDSKRMNSDRDSDIKQNGYSDIEHYERNCATSKTDLSDDNIECTNEQKSSVFVPKQSLDKQCAQLQNNNPCDHIQVNENELAHEMSSSETKSSPQFLSSDSNKKDSDSSPLVNSCEADSVHKVDSISNASDQDGCIKKEDCNTSFPECEQNGKSDEQCYKIGKLKRSDGSYNLNGEIMVNKQTSIIADNATINKTSEKHNCVKSRFEDIDYTETNKYSDVKEEIRNYNDSENNFGEFNNEGNELTPVICSVIGNALMDSSDDMETTSDPPKENALHEGPIIVSSNTVTEMEVANDLKEDTSTKMKSCLNEEKGESDIISEHADQNMSLSKESEHTDRTDTPCDSTPVDALEKLSEATSHNDEKKCNKRKREDDTNITERIENAKKKIKKTRCEWPKYNFNATEDHRFWCIWKIKTIDFSGVDETPKAGWQYAFDIIHKGLELLNKDRNLSYCEVQEKTIGCINTICSMGHPG